MKNLDPSTLFSVKGFVVVITGGGTGIGLMLAQALEANNVVVYILGRRQEVLEQAASTAKHSNIHVFRAEVTSKSDLAAAADHVRQRSGYINLVIANSGTTGPTLMGLPKNPSLIELRDYLLNWDIEDYNHTFAVNTTGAFSTLVAFLELLDEGKKAGSIEQRSHFIGNASAGAFNRVPMAGFAYSGSKSALVHTMKQFGTKLVPYGIRCNTIAPGCKSSTVLVLLHDPWRYENEHQSLVKTGLGFNASSDSIY